MGQIVRSVGLNQAGMNDQDRQREQQMQSPGSWSRVGWVRQRAHEILSKIPRSTLSCFQLASTLTLVYVTWKGGQLLEKVTL